MKQALRHYETDLAVIGSGLAGLAATIFAQRHGISTVVVGNTGALAYTTGYFDLFGMMDGKAVNDPWSTLDHLRETTPGHPLARLSANDIRQAFEIFTATLGEWGLPYTTPGDSNVTALLPGGMTKPTLCVPSTMQGGVEAFARRARTAIVGIEGLQGFSANEFVANMTPRWTGLRAHTLAFPGMDEGAQVFAEVMARSLEVEENRISFAERLRPCAENVDFIGVPAMLGMHRPDVVLADLERRTGVRLFEIPTMPPAVPGIRLRELMENALPERGIGLISQHKVEQLSWRDGGAVLSLHDAFGQVDIVAKRVLLATGRFLSGGLVADRSQLREPLMGLDVYQSTGREGWYGTDYLDKAGHPINRFGLEVDDTLHPLDKEGRVINPNLFAAGSILAHHDWALERCGAGVAIATAYGMINGS